MTFKWLRKNQPTHFLHPPLNSQHSNAKYKCTLTQIHTHTHPYIYMTQTQLNIKNRKNYNFIDIRPRKHLFDWTTQTLVENSNDSSQKDSADIMIAIAIAADGIGFHCCCCCSCCFFACCCCLWFKAKKQKLFAKNKFAHDIIATLKTRTFFSYFLLFFLQLQFLVFVAASLFVCLLSYMSATINI